MVEDEKPADPRTLAANIWDAHVPENFKLPSLVSFNGKRNLHEHVVANNTQMVIIEVYDSIKCKLMVRTFKEIALR